MANPEKLSSPSGPQKEGVPEKKELWVPAELREEKKSTPKTPEPSRIDPAITWGQVESKTPIPPKEEAKPKKEEAKSKELWVPPEIESPRMEDIRQALQEAEVEAKEGKAKVEAVGGTPEEMKGAEVAGEKRITGVKEASETAIKNSIPMFEGRIRVLREKVAETSRRGKETEVLKLEEQIRTFERRKREFELEPERRRLREAVKEAQARGVESEILKAEERLRAVEGEQYKTRQKSAATAVAKESAEEKPATTPEAPIDKLPPETEDFLGNVERRRLREAERPKEKAPAAEGVRPPEVEKAEGEKLKEKTPEVKFTTAANQKLFDKLPPETKNFLGRLYERVHPTFIDRAKIWFNDHLPIFGSERSPFGLKHHEKKAAKIASELEATNSEIKSKESQLGTYEATVKSLEARGGEFSAGERAVAERERRELERDLEALKNKRDREQTELEYRNSKKAIYENKRKEIVEDVSGRIKERLKPYEEKIEDLRARKEQFDAEAKAFAEKKEAFANQIKTIEEERKKAVFHFERQRLGRDIKELMKELRLSENLFKERLGSRIKIELQLVNLNRKAGHWRDTLNEFARVSQRNVAYEQVGARAEEGLDLKRAQVLRERGTAAAAPSGTEQAKAREAKEVKPRTMSVGAYLGQWNKYFGSELPVREDVFFKTLGVSDQEKPLSELGFDLRTYYDFMRSHGNTDRRLTKPKLIEKIKILETFITKP